MAGRDLLLGVFAFLLVVVGVAKGAEADSGRMTLVQQAPPAGALIVNDNPGGLGQPAACADPNYTSSDLGQATDAASPDVAPAGSVIYVCSGTYTGGFAVTEPLTLLGAQYGVSATSSGTGSSQETVIDESAGANSGQAITFGPGLFPAGRASGTVNGFMIIDASQAIAANNTGDGGYTLVDNVISDTSGLGISLNTGSAVNPLPTLIQGNRFSYDNVSVWLSASPYDIDAPASNVTINQNSFNDNLNNDINTPGSGEASVPNRNLTITNNTVTDDLSFALILNSTGVQMSGNAITWTDPEGLPDFSGHPNLDNDLPDTPVYAIGVGAGNTDVTVSGNTIDGAYTGTDNSSLYWDEFGILLSNSNPDSGGVASTGVSITDNTLSGQVVGIGVHSSATRTSSSGNLVGPTTGFLIDGNTITDAAIANGGGCTLDAAGHRDGGVGIWIQDFNTFAGVSQTGIQNSDFTVSDNNVTNSACKGLWIENAPGAAVNSGATIQDNTVSSSAATDYEDDSVGAASEGTANTWTGNTGSTSTPAGLFLPPAPPATTTTTTSTTTTTTTTTTTSSPPTAATPTPPAPTAPAGATVTITTLPTEAEPPVNQPESAAAIPGASGQVAVTVGSSASNSSGSTSAAAATTSAPVSVSLSWPADAFETPVTVEVTPQIQPTRPAGSIAPAPTPVAGGFAVGNTVVQINVTTAAGEAVTEFSAPLIIHISSLGAGQTPAYSHNGTTWTMIPQLGSPSLPDNQPDGYFTNPDRSIDIYTRHATLFGLLLDAQAPTKPVVTARITGAKLRLTAKATDNVRVTSYRLLENGNLVKRTTQPDLVLTSHIGEFQIVAVDGAGNLSKTSTPILVTRTSTKVPRFRIKQ